MKKLTLALGIASLALTVTAASRSDPQRSLGRHGYDNNVVMPQVSVPEATMTLPLAIVGLAALALAGAALDKKHPCRR